MAPTHPSSEKSENLRERAVSGTLWYGGTRAVIQVFSWITTIFVARVLTPDDYGLFGMALLYLGFVEVFNQLGFGAAIVQKRDLQDGDLDTIFWMTCGLGLLFYLMTFIAAPWVALFFRQPTLVPVLRIQGLLFILSGLRAVPWNLLTRSVNFKRRSLAEAAANLLASILTVTAAYGGWGVWSLVLGYVARDGAMTAQAYIQVPWRPRWRFHPPTLREVLPFSLNVTASTIGWMTYESVDKLVVGKLLGRAPLGFYTMAQRFTIELGGRITSILNQVAFPVYSRLQDDPARLKNYFLQASRLAATAVFPMMMGLLLVADIGVVAILTEKWAPAVLPLQLFCVAAMVNCLASLLNPALMGSGRADLVRKFHLSCLGVMTAGFLIGARWGLAGVAAAWTILLPPLVFAYYALTRRCIGYEWSELLAAYRPATVATLVMMGLTLALRWAISPISTGVGHLTLLIVAAMLSYMAVFAVGFRREVTEMFRLFLGDRMRKAAA